MGPVGADCWQAGHEHHQPAAGQRAQPAGSWRQYPKALLLSRVITEHSGSAIGLSLLGARSWMEIYGLAIRLQPSPCLV